MAQVSKAQLVTENQALKEQLVLIQRELDTLKQPKTAVPAAPTTRQAITADNPIFAGLERHVPHSKITCPTHRDTQANKAGFCMQCACARIRGDRAAA